MVSVIDLRVGYGSDPLFGPLNAQWDAGEIVGIAAPNGFGKTTLLQVLGGDTGPKLSGSVEIAGCGDLDNPEFRRRVAYVSGEGALLAPNASVHENLAMARKLWGSSADLEALERTCGIERFASKRVVDLSQGMRQQASLAAGFATGVSTLLLDEPMNALDPNNVERFSALLRRHCEQGGCVVLSSHLLDNLAAICTQILVFRDGKPACVTLEAAGPTPKELYWEAYGERSIKMHG